MQGFSKNPRTLQFAGICGIQVKRGKWLFVNKEAMKAVHEGIAQSAVRAIKGSNNEEVFEAYAENKTPAAWRIFWHSGLGRKSITILAITPRP